MKLIIAIFVPFTTFCFPESLYGRTIEDCMIEQIVSARGIYIVEYEEQRAGESVFVVEEVVRGSLSMEGEEINYPIQKCVHEVCHRAFSVDQFWEEDGFHVIDQNIGKPRYLAALEAGEKYILLDTGGVLLFGIQPLENPAGKEWLVFIRSVIDGSVKNIGIIEWISRKSSVITGLFEDGIIKNIRILHGGSVDDISKFRIEKRTV